MEFSELLTNLCSLGCVCYYDGDFCILNLSRLYSLGYIVFVINHEDSKACINGSGDLDIIDLQYLKITIENIESVLNVDDFCINCSETLYLTDRKIKIRKSLIDSIIVQVDERQFRFSFQKFNRYYR